MSEFSPSKAKRLVKLRELSSHILQSGNASSFIRKNSDFIPTVVPSDFISLFDEIIREGHPMEDIKVLTNKVLNVFYEPIRDFERIEPPPGSFLAVLEQNNIEMDLLLNEIRPVYKSLVKERDNADLQLQLAALFRRLEGFVKHYTIKENVLFPVIEKAWPDYRCLQIMWSFHDDIRRNLKMVISQLGGGNMDFKIFNRCVGDLFFNMRAIKLREERILFPLILSTIPESQLESMKREASELGYPYVHPDLKDTQPGTSEPEGSLVNLGTGKISVEQIMLIFNHLPVDITFVDENNRVCFFSAPRKRIFPRTTSVLGREVSNCHPPESVHVVEQILESFRSGKKDQAEFWIQMKGEYILIRYFAVRDGEGLYKGVIEVSQEISGIKALEGEKRLLDW